MQILLLGATGKIGSQMVKDLQLRGIRPRIGVRDPDRAKARFGPDLEYIRFDFSEGGAFASALDGVSRLFFIAPMKEPDDPVGAMLEAARVAGVRHITFSSGRTTGDIEGKPLNRVEKLVAGAGVPYTILRPGWFMQNFLNWLSRPLLTEGKLYLPAGTARTAFVDVRDIAAVAVQTLLQTGHENRLYNLTSDEALDHHEVVRRISAAAGKPMVYIPLERAEFVRTMAAYGWTETAAHYAADLFDIVRTGKEAELSDDVYHVLRRNPIRFGEFVHYYREEWKLE